MSDVTAVMDLEVEEPRLSLPPGFRFHPTDEEVVTHYLTPKAVNNAFSCLVIADVDLNKTEPWDLPGKAKMGEKEWYFFVHKDRKYPTGTRTNRATEKGYWKATGKDKEVFRGKGRDAVLVGMKKTLVFYTGRAPRGDKTPYVMHEYRLEGQLPHRLPRSARNDWAVCRVFDKDLAAKNAPPQTASAAVGVMEDPYAFLDVDDFFNNPDLPMLMDSPSGADDFAGASSSTSSAAVPLEPDMEHLSIKTEPPVPQQQMQSPNYFYMPAATPNGNHGGGRVLTLPGHGGPADRDPQALQAGGGVFVGAAEPFARLRRGGARRRGHLVPDAVVAVVPRSGGPWTTPTCGRS
ncbi:hypothetical protein CFC21_015359, partial [Triticum aestivum]